MCTTHYHRPTPLTPSPLPLQLRILMSYPSKKGTWMVNTPFTKWYCLDRSNGIPTIQPHDATPKPNRKVNWSEYTKPPSDDHSKKSADFQIGMDLMYRDVAGNSVPVVYEGYIANGILHTACFVDGSKLAFHDSYLQLLDQPNFSNMPKTSLDSSNEVGACIYS